LDEETWQPELQVQFGCILTIDDTSVTFKTLTRPTKPLEEDLEEERDADEPALGLDEAETTQTLTIQELYQGEYRSVQ
jgi:hypothetical protein